MVLVSAFGGTVYRGDSHLHENAIAAFSRGSISLAVGTLVPVDH